MKQLLFTNILFLSGYFFLQPLSASNLKECVRIRIVKGTECKDLEIGFDYSKCIPSRAEEKVVKGVCWNHKVVARSEENKERLKATFEAQESRWGKEIWELKTVKVESLANEIKAADGKAGEAKKPIDRSIASFIPKTIQQQIQKKEHPEKPVETVTPEPIPSAEVPSGEESSYGISGNWAGIRKQIEDHGYSLAVVYKGEGTRVMGGGTEIRNSWLENYDFRLEMDWGKAFNLEGWSSLVYFIGNQGADSGNRPTRYVGDIQGTSNIETFVDDYKFYEIWVQKTFYEDRLSFLAGLHDLNSEFYVTPTATLYLHSSFGLGYEFSQTGNNGSAVFPYTSPAIRVRTEPSKNFYFQVAAFNAQAGNPAILKGNSMSFRAQDGFLVIQEAGYLGDTATPAKYTVGTWSYTRTYDHLLDTQTDANGEEVAKQVISSGAYLLIDHSWNDLISTFLTYGVASTESNAVRDCLTAGFAFTGLIPGRSKDRLGVGIARITPGAERKQAALQEDDVVLDGDETAYELTYRAEIMDGFAVQPDFQWVVNPSFLPERENAVVGSIRFEVSL